MAWKIWTREEDEAVNKNYDRWNALFVVSFIAMQLLEGFVWLGHDWVRYLIPYLVALQPAVQSFGNAYYNGQPLFYIPVVVAIATLLFIRVPKSIGVGLNGHLTWSMRFDNHQIFVIYYLFYYTFMITPLLWQRPLTRYAPLIVYGVFILIWSLWKYRTTGEFSSMWCFLAIGYAFIAYMVNAKTQRLSPGIINGTADIPDEGRSGNK